MSHRQIQGMGYPQKRIDRDILLPSFNLANIVGMEVSLLCQPFLRKARFFPSGAECLP